MRRDYRAACGPVGGLLCGQWTPDRPELFLVEADYAGARERSGPRI